MGAYPRLMPTQPRMFTAEVTGSRRISPSFQRVTIASADLADFDWRGLDHWFRLFFPLQPNIELKLPTVNGRQWWKSYLEIPDAQRPHCSNYTVAGYRPLGTVGELDIDVVLHWHEGQLSGVAAWAVGAQTGERWAILHE